MSCDLPTTNVNICKLFSTNKFSLGNKQIKKNLLFMTMIKDVLRLLLDDLQLEGQANFIKKVFEAVKPPGKQLLRRDDIEKDLEKIQLEHLVYSHKIMKTRKNKRVLIK